MIDTIAFRVIGELKADPAHLLVLDDDGRYYDYDILREEIVPVDLDGSWAIDVVEESNLIIEAPMNSIELDRLLTPSAAKVGGTPGCAAPGLLARNRNPG